MSATLYNHRGPGTYLYGTMDSYPIPKSMDDILKMGLITPSDGPNPLPDAKYLILVKLPDTTADVAIIDFKKLTAINKTIRWYDEFPTSDIDGLFVITPSYKVVPADNPFGYNMEEQLTQLKLATMKSGKLEEVRAPYGLLIYPINYGKILLVLIIIVLLIVLIVVMSIYYWWIKPRL